MSAGLPSDLPNTYWLHHPATRANLNQLNLFAPPGVTPVQGTAASEILTGTAGDDWLIGGGGDDTYIGWVNDPNTNQVDSGNNTYFLGVGTGNSTVVMPPIGTPVDGFEIVYLQDVNDINGIASYGRLDGTDDYLITLIGGEQVTILDAIDPSTNTLRENLIIQFHDCTVFDPATAPAPDPDPDPDPAPDPDPDPDPVPDPPAITIENNNNSAVTGSGNSTVSVNNNNENNSSASSSVNGQAVAISGGPAITPVNAALPADSPTAILDDQPTQPIPEEPPVTILSSGNGATAIAGPVTITNYNSGNTAQDDQQ